jgi:31-O-methyltransferase
VPGLARMTAGAMRLPNGLQVMQLNPGETSLQYRNIFVNREYGKHGIRLEPSSVIFDIGANIGIASLYFHAECPDARIFAFEPAAPLFEALRANIAQCGSGARAFCRAVGARPGTAMLTIYPDTTAMSSIYADPLEDQAVTRQFLANSGFAGADIEDMVAGRYDSIAQECEVTTVSMLLAELRLDRLDLLKINVEKAESDVMAGIIAGDWPKVRQLVMQVHDIDGRLAKVRSDLTKRGYDVFVRQDPLLRGTEIYDLAARRDRG